MPRGIRILALSVEMATEFRKAPDWCDDHDVVSTGSGSDRVSIHETEEFAKPMTRSLPLPVLTSRGRLPDFKIGAARDTGSGEGVGNGDAQIVFAGRQSLQR